MEVTRLNLPEFNKGLYFNGIYEHQLNLMNNLKRAGKLPYPWPLDIESRKGQALVRELISYIIEEIAEAEKSFQEAYQLYDSWRYTAERSKLVSLAIEFTEEVVDSLHFVFELFIYLGIDGELLSSYHGEILKQKGLECLGFSDYLTTALSLAHHNNWIDEDSRIIVQESWFDAFNEDLALLNYRMNFIVPEVYPKFCWNIVQTLYKAQNFLKLKPWRSHGKEVSVNAFFEQIVDFWLSYVEFLDLVGATSKTLYIRYLEKNEKNLVRIENKY